MKKTITTIAAVVLTISSLLAQNKSEPILKVGRGKDRMPSIEFKNQSYCRIESNNDTTYLVNKATIFFIFMDSSHNRFPNYNYKEGECFRIHAININNNSLINAKSLIDILQPKDLIIFDNIIGISKYNTTKNIKPRVFTLY